MDVLNDEFHVCLRVSGDQKPGFFRVEERKR